MNRKDAVRAACLSATVAVAWAGSSTPAFADGPGVTQPVYIRTDFSRTFSKAIFVAYAPTTNERQTVYVSINNDNLVEIDEAFFVGTGGGAHFAFVGCGEGSGGNFVAASFVNPTSALGVPFETVFSGFNEADVYEAMQNNTPLLDSFIGRVVSMPTSPVGLTQPTSTSVLHFSDGALVGTIQASLTPIPEPTSAIMVGGALVLASQLRRRVN